MGFVKTRRVSLSRYLNALMEVTTVSGLFPSQELKKYV